MQQPISQNIVEEYEKVNELDRDALKLYISEVYSISRLSKEEEKQMFLEYRLGNQELEEKIIVANLRLVFPVARKFVGCGLPFLDLVQCGNIGLIKAVRKYNVVRGTAFSTYATWWIIHEVDRAIANTSRTIRLPNDLVAHINMVRREKDNFYRDYSKQPSVRELSELVGQPEKEIKDCLLYECDTISLNEKLHEDDEIAIIDQIEDKSLRDPESIVENMEMKVRVREILDILPAKERNVLLCRYCGENGKETYDKVGKMLGISRQRVHQIESKALQKLKDNSILRMFYDEYMGVNRN